MSIYVAQHGNDSNPGTEQAPVRTTKQALKLADSGDNVFFKRGGEYDEIALRESRHSMTFTAYGEGPNPLFRGRGIYARHDREFADITVADLHFRGSGHGDGVRWLGATDGLVLYGLRVENFRQNIIIQGDADRPIENVAIEDCVVLDAHDPNGDGHSHGVYANFVQNLAVRRCLFDNNGRRFDGWGTPQNHALYINVGCGPIVFTDNVCTRNFADGGQFRTGGVIRRNVFAFNAIGTDIGAVRGGSDPIAGGIGLEFCDNIVAWCGDIDDAGQPRSIGILAGNYDRLILKDNWLLFGVGRDSGRHNAILYEESDTNQIAEYSASNNRHFGWKQALRDKAGVGRDFGLVALDDHPNNRVAAGDWIKRAREHWGEEGYRADDLARLVLGDSQSQPLPPPAEEPVEPAPPVEAPSAIEELAQRVGKLEVELDTINVRLDGLSDYTEELVRDGYMKDDLITAIATGDRAMLDALWEAYTNVKGGA